MSDGFTFEDPEDVPEDRVRLRAKDLVGKPTIFRITGEKGVWPAREATADQEASAEAPWLAADCWTLDRAGIVDREPSVRISWWKVYEQLKNKASGSWVLGTPKKNPKAVELMHFSDQGKAQASKLKPELLEDVVRFEKLREEWAAQAAEKTHANEPEDHDFDFSDEPPF